MNPASSRWRRLPRGVQAAAVVGIVFVVLVVAVSVVDRATRGRQESSFDTQGSTRSTARNGTKAYRILLDQLGAGTSQLGRRPHAGLDSSATLMILDNWFPSDADRRAVSAFADRGGRVVIGGLGAADWLSQDRPSPVRGSPRSVTTELGQRFEIETAGTSRWRSSGGPELTAVRKVGDGVVVLIADSSLLENELLGKRDNAAFGLALARTDRRVIFLDQRAAATRATGWSAVPEGWKIAILGGALSWLLTAIALGHRIGSAEDQHRELNPPRGATAEVLAAGLQRSRQPAEALDELRRTARRHVIHEARLEPDADPALVIDAAIASGWSVAEARALVDRPSDRDSVLALGRAFSRTQRGT